MNRYIINHRLHDDFNKTQFHTDSDCCDCHAIGPIAPLNVLVGANNSGKSRFMRSLIKSSSIILGSNREPTTIEQLQSIRQSLIEAKKEQGHLKLVISTRIIDDISQVGKSITDKLATHLAKRKNIDYLAELPENIRRLINLYERCDNKERFESFKQALLSIQMDLRMLLAAFRKRDCNRYGPKDRFNERLGHIGYTFDSHLIEDEHIDTIKCLSKKLVKLQNLSLPPLCKTYIPALRCATTLFSRKSDSNVEILTEDILRTSVEEYYSLHSQKTVNSSVHTGLSLYKSIRRARNNTRDQRNKIDEFCDLISKSFFENKPVDIVAQEDDTNSNNHILLYIDGEERKLHDFGDGFQSLLTLLFPLFMANNDEWFFIEEPELHLHPSLQRVFINQLLSNPHIQEKKLIIFIATHSNHILDLSATSNKDVSFFLFKKTSNQTNEDNEPGKNNQIEIKHVENSSIQLLDELGVLNTSVFQTNCSIWVEGPSDRKIIKALLKCYSEKQPSENGGQAFIEDLDYAFFLYGGSLLSHYMFGEEDKNATERREEKEKIKALALSNRILLIADKDEGKEKNHKKLREIFAPIPGSIYYPLTVREIENLFTIEQLKKIIKRVTSRTTPGLDDVVLDRKKIKTASLGEYLSNKFSSPRFSRKGSKALKPEYKRDFSIEFEAICKFEELSSDARKVAEKVYNFIEESNKHKRF